MNTIVFISIAIALCFISRPCVLWYFKIDEKVKLLKEIANNLKKGSEEK